MPNLEDLIKQVRFTVLLGKNGGGKSSQLRRLDEMDAIKSTYLTPERGGVLRYDANLDHNMESNPQILVAGRRRNRNENFRAASAVQWRALETDVLREIELNEDVRTQLNYKFQHTIDRINDLLPNVEMRRAKRGFEMYARDGQKIGEDDLSSGESELLALAIEVLVFSRDATKDAVLLMDEPDVHLHPDLQQRFMGFVEAVAVEKNFKVVVATHSTALLAGFSAPGDVQVVPVTGAAQRDFSSFKIDVIARTLLPIFGAHPLSSLFNKSPPLLVEGEDDRRVVDQLVRSSSGKYCFSPAVVGTVNQMNRWELWLDKYLPVLYDDPRAYSLRDLDASKVSEIVDMKHVKRVRLNCYAIENLLLCDESLLLCGKTADELSAEIAAWVEERPAHKASPHLKTLMAGFEGRRTIKIKDCRNVLVALLGITQPWEVHVGQLLAVAHVPTDSEHSLFHYLGPGVTTKLLKWN